MNFSVHILVVRFLNWIFDERFFLKNRKLFFCSDPNVEMPSLLSPGLAGGNRKLSEIKLSVKFWLPVIYF